MKIKDREFGIMISSDKLKERVYELGKEISKDYEGQDPLFIVILNGAFMFASDLLKEIKTPCEISFIKLNSYAGTSSTGLIEQLIGLKEETKNRHVILVEDIVDTGNTMAHVISTIQVSHPASIEIVALLHKPAALKKDIKVKYLGFEIPPAFVVGYGLDYDGYGRNLSDIYVVNE